MRNILLSFILFIFIGNPANEQLVWKHSYTKNGIEVFNRSSKDSNLKEFKGEVKVSASLSTIIAAIDDIENFANWAYQTRSAKMLKDEGDTQYIHVVTKAVWPVLDRDIVYKCQIAQNPVTKEVTIAMNGLPNYIPPQKEIVRMPDAGGLFILTPLNKKEVKITFLLHAVPGGQIPQWMADIVANDSPYVTLNNLREEIKKEKYSKAVIKQISDL
jgi:hypothetical protein